MDTLIPIERSARMALVRSKDTKPEMIVRRLVHRLGYRYRLHRRDLPGSPDLVFVCSRKAIFIHGCFWHQHRCAAGNRCPKTRVGFWRAKLEGNKARDRRSIAKLRRDGWTVLVLWECEIGNKPVLIGRINAFLSRPHLQKRIDL